MSLEVNIQPREPDEEFGTRPDEADALRRFWAKLEEVSERRSAAKKVVKKTLDE